MNFDVNKAIDDFRSSLELLEEYINIFHSGKKIHYLPISVELRKLLCDGKNSLFTRLVPDLKLHPLMGYVSDEEDKKHIEKKGSSIKKLLGEATFLMAGRYHFDGKGNVKIKKLFNENKECIPLDEWLEMPLFNIKITIRELIRSVSDKLGAHSDKKFNETLIFTKSIKLVDEDVHIRHVVAIGEYVLKIGKSFLKKLS